MIRPSRTLLRLAPLVLAVLCATLLLALLPFAHRDLDRPTNLLVRSALAQGSTHFAIADFDGDLQPDLAMIRVTHEGAPQTEYSLELKFSSGPRPSIGLLGPAGGLEISPQDVNGDKFADLVITSQMDSEFVAILLNDGKGNFTHAESSDYPQVGKRGESRITAPPDYFGYRVAVGQSSSPIGEEVRPGDWNHARLDPSALALVPVQILADSLVLLKPGRAPPTA
jgi:hypothetical protein